MDNVISEKKFVIQRVLVGNIAAGLSGKLWRAVVQIVATPFFILMLGPEAYGLVAFYFTLLTFLVFLDQGVSPVLVREFGRMSGRTENADSMRDLLRSMEILSFALAGIIGVLLVLTAPVIAHDWLNASSLPAHKVENAIRLMGLTIACQWPSFLYSSGYTSLHRQGMLAKINIVTSSVQYGGAALLLFFVARDIEIFLAWQAISALGATLALGYFLWRGMPESEHRPHFSLARLQTVAHFASGTLIIGIATSLLGQAGNLVVSKYAPLDQFTSYAMSFMLAGQVFMLVVTSISSAIMPYLSRLVADGHDEVLAREYHRWTQIIVFVSLVVIMPIGVFPQPLLEIWLGINSPLIAPMSMLLPWVIAGYILSGIVSMPFMLQMAAGRVRLTIITNMIAVTLFLLGLYILVPAYGLIGGALCWLALNVGYFLFFVPLAHRQILRSELIRWWLGDVSGPVCAGMVTYWVMKTIMPPYQSPFFGFLEAATSSLVVAVVLFSCLPSVREMTVSLLGGAGSVLRVKFKNRIEE